MIRFKKFLFESKNGLRKKVGLEFTLSGRTLILTDVSDIPIRSKDGAKEVDFFFRGKAGAERHNVNKFKSGANFASLFIFDDMKKRKKVVFVLYVRNNKSIVTSHKLDKKLNIKGGVESLNLKPQSFGLKERMKYGDFVATLRKNVVAREDLSIPIKRYLLYLIDEAENVKSKPPDVKGLPIAQIGKNFGEMTGPIRLYNKKMFTVMFHKPNDIIIFPLAGNNKLVDYAVEEKSGVTHNFSAKFKGGAATSLSSLIDIIKSNKSKFRENPKEIKVLFLINDNSMVEGVIKVAESLGLFKGSQRKLWDAGEFEDDEFDEFKQELTPNLDKAIPKFWVLAGVAKKVARRLNEIFDFDTVIRKAMAIASVHQVNMVIGSSGIPTYKVAVAGADAIKSTKKWQIDAMKSFFASSSPVQKLSFKLK